MANYTFPKAVDWHNLSRKGQDAVKFGGRLLLPKRDGCCVKVLYTDNDVEFLSSDDKPVRSLEHLREYLNSLRRDPFLHFSAGTKLICEAYIPGRLLEYVSGKVRQHSPEPELRLMIWDAVQPWGADLGFSPRLEYVACVLGTNSLSAVTVAPTRFLGGLGSEEKYRQEAWKAAQDAVLTGLWGHLAGPFDGAILRDPGEPYTEGRSSGGIVKLKPTVTYDLEVVRVELGRGARTGKPTASLVLRWSLGREQKCGSGLTARIIAEMHADPDSFVGRVAEVEAKAARSGDGMLLEPAFKRWRDDKTEGEF